MDEVILILMINESDREWNEGNSLRETRRRLRDTSDPFSISENAFMSIYRLSKEALHALITELSPFMPNAQRNTSVPHVLQVLAAVNLMASGSNQRRVGQDFLTCMSQTTISKSLHNVVNALNYIMGKWIGFPVTEARQATIKKIFFDHTGFPGVIGAIDGTHIAIFPPEQEKEHLYINRKLYHSLNVLIVRRLNKYLLVFKSLVKQSIS